MPQEFNEDDLVRDLLEQAEAEAQQESTESFISGSGFGLGCGLGCLLGPFLGFALLMLYASLRPDSPGGGPVGWLVFFVQAALVGAFIGSQLLPFLLRLFFKRRNMKRH